MNFGVLGCVITPGLSLPRDTLVTLVDNPPTKQVLKLHEGLRKAESSLLIQVRTGKIGLNKFLYSRQVPGYSAQCQCRGGEETPRHIALFCIRVVDRNAPYGPREGDQWIIGAW